MQNVFQRKILRAKIGLETSRRKWWQTGNRWECICLRMSVEEILIKSLSINENLKLEYQRMVSQLSSYLFSHEHKEVN